MPERKAVIVRACMGDYAYEVTGKLCAETGAVGPWDCMVYKLSPAVALLSHNEGSPSREHAERNARQLIALCIELDGLLDRIEARRELRAA